GSPPVCQRQRLYCLLWNRAPSRDVVFLLDGSDDTRAGFPAMRDFVQRVVETLAVDENKDRVALVQYSRDPAANFYLNTYTTKENVVDAVTGLRHKGGRPLNTGAALQYVRDNVFTASSGSRRLDGVPQLLILLSGGRSFDNVDTPAAALKELGVKVFAVGTRSSDIRELQKISYDPSFALSVSEFTDLPNVHQQLISVLGTVIVKDITFIRAPSRDVVFLLDGSDDTRAGFPAMRDFVQRVVETLAVDENKDRVALVQYSRDPAAQFYLNTFNTKDDIVNTVRGLRHKGGRPLNTGAALQYVRDDIFTASSGSRSLQGIPQMLILLSGGRSNDNVDVSASALKESGVLIFGIGTQNSKTQIFQSGFPKSNVDLFSLLFHIRLVDKSIARKDVVFLLDGSDGTRSGFPAMRDFVQRVVEKLTVEENRDRVSVVQYSREPEANFYLNTYTTKENVVDAVTGLRHKGGRPLNTGAALQYVRDNVFTASSGSRRLDGVPQLLILLSGGRSFDNVDTPAAALKELGVKVFAIGTRSSDSREMQRISQDPSQAMSVSDFTDLPSIQQQLLSSTDLCNLCLFSVDLETARKDVVFLLDGSDGTRSGFPAMRDFVQRVVEKLTVEENRDRVSVVQYSREPEANFYLNTYTTKENVVDAVTGLRHKGGRPLNTGAALQYVRDNVFTASSGSRRLDGVPQLLILLSGGRSFDNVDTPAAALKELGVKVFAIGTRSSDSREMQRISQDPSHAMSVSDFTDLPSIQQQLFVQTDLCNLCLFSVDLETARKDVVFLLDGSDGTRSGFPAMRDFVQRVVEKLTVEENRDRVSVVQYSREPEANFYLNTYTTKENVVDAVTGLRHKGGRPLNTGAALQYVRDNVFTASSGSRRLDGVPQLLILLSGGRSFDNVDTPAAALKELGVKVFAVGTRSSDIRELQKISYDPSFALSVSEFTDLPNVHQQLISSRAPSRDVVFLLDGSDGTRAGFPAMRDFVQRVVETLAVDENKDRVALVQYSRDPAAQFYLNTFNTKDDIVNTVRGLRHKGGRPLNTGAALQYVRDNIFTASSGSRSLQGIPQMLILLSGGRSNDNVDVSASALKESGVLIFGIGTQNSSREVERIVTDPSYSQSVSEFTDIARVQEQYLSSLKTQLLKAIPITPTVDKSIARKDVVFLLDGSDGTRSGFPAMRDFVQRVVEKLTVEENRDRVSVVQYSREPEANFYLNTYTTKENVVDAVTGLRHKGGRPLNTGAALQYVRDNVFTASSGSRRLDGVPQLLILLSGGRSFDNVDTPAAALKELGVKVFGGRPLNTGAALQYVRDNVFTASSGSRRLDGVPQLLILLSGGRSFDNVDTPAAALKELGVKVFAIGTRSSDSREMQRISQDPSHAMSVSDFTDLPSIQQQLVRTFDLETTRKDVVFLLDGSDGTRSGFPAMRDFVQRVVEKLTVEENRDRVSVVQYSREPEANFYLNTYTTKENVVDAVTGLRHKGGRPLNTGAALQYVRDNVFTASSGSRRLDGVPQLLILLSGGRSFDNVDTPAAALKELGVKVFAVGTRSSDIRELQKISYDPSFALSVSEFTDLPNFHQQLISVLGTVIVRAPSRDVVFLLDGSDGTRAGFPAMRDFVQRVVETLAVDENKDRVALVQYSRDPAAQFYLNTFNTKDDIVNTVRGLRHKGGRPLNTGAALQYVRDNIFTASSGSRSLQGIPQMLILLSGGRSNDNVDVSASALKESGVLIFGIGTQNSSREVERIVTDPSYSQSVSEFTDIARVQEPDALSRMTKETQIFQSGFPKSNVDLFSLLFHIRLVDKSIARKDVVFLLDGSDGTRSGFPAMRDFVQRVVEKLTVEENRDRVSVVQYSREPEANFYLNTYTTKENVVDAVTGLRHKGGRPLNTGAALQYVRDNVFTASSGSRRLDGVPQLLILLSGGRSFDNVETPAAALKELGVKVFAIGTRSSDSREMQRISQDPSHAMSVSDFTDLPSIQQQLLSSVETVVVGVTTETPTVLGKSHCGDLRVQTC
uniref:VWFA domain-containing protein n=1 Tax=Esox lucius TaxID=8010 RepID=A0AAY5KSK8_ESOLU